MCRDNEVPCRQYSEDEYRQSFPGGCTHPRHRRHSLPPFPRLFLHTTPKSCSHLEQDRLAVDTFVAGKQGEAVAAPSPSVDRPGERPNERLTPLLQAYA